MERRWRSMVPAGVLGSVLAFGFGVAPPASAQQSIDWQAVDAALGRTGAMQPGDNYRFNMPRSDLRVVVQGVQIRPSFALGSWLAFKPSGANQVVVMGDLVLTESELNPVLARLQEGGVGQTAVHKHLPEMEPAIWWAHVHAQGNPVEIARTVREALALTGTPPQTPAAPPPELALDTAQISRILGYPGRNNGGVYSVSVPRKEAIRSHGIEIPANMGLTTAINFQPTGNGRAAINGDFVMVATEVDRVIAALRQNDIQIVELHHHLTDEEPRLFFIHFWANDDALALARGLRAALDQTNITPPAAR